MPQPPADRGPIMDEIVISRLLSRQEAEHRAFVTYRMLVRLIIGTVTITGSTAIFLIMLAINAPMAISIVLVLAVVLVLVMIYAVSTTLGTNAVKMRAAAELRPDGRLTVRWESGAMHLSAANLARSVRYEEIRKISPSAGIMVVHMKIASALHLRLFIGLPNDFVPPSIRQQFGVAN